MTYDPLSYGQIKLRDRAANPNDTPDDILFEDAGPGYTSDEAQQADWSEVDSEFQEFAPGGNPQQASDFGADVLGESAPPPAPTPMASAGPVSMSAPAPEYPPAPAPAPRPQPAMQQPAPVAAAAPSAPAKPRQPMPRRPASARARKPLRRRSGPMGTLIPAVVVAGGGSVAAWFYMMEQNLVMAGIFAAISLVGAALSRLMFR